MTPQRLAEIERLLREAQPGEWWVKVPHKPLVFQRTKGDLVEVARLLILELLREVKRSERQKASALKAIENLLNGDEGMKTVK